MAQVHSVSVETYVDIVRPQTDRNWEYEWEIRKTQVRISGEPLSVETLENGMQKAKMVAVVWKNEIITTDEENKPWRCVDWFDDRIYEGAEFSFNFDSKFEVLDDQSDWIDNDELDD